MASNLRVDTILPSSGTTLGIGTANGTINFLGTSSINTTGVVTATSFSGSGANLTSIPITSGVDNRVITASGANTIQGEANLIFDGNRLGINNPNFGNYSADCDDFIIQGSANTGITINSGGTGQTNTGNIAFAEGNGSGGSADAFRGGISYKHNDDYMNFHTNNTERLRIGNVGQIGLSGANYGTARQVMVSNGSSSAVSWSSNPFLLDMDSLGDIDYDGVFLRYRETAAVTGNGLVYLGLCKSTTNCPAGRIGIPVGFIPSTAYNGHFRVDKVGITPWPDSSGHRYEFYAIISDYVASGKLGVFYLTNSTN